MITGLLIALVALLRRLWSWDAAINPTYQREEHAQNPPISWKSSAPGGLGRKGRRQR